MRSQVDDSTYTCETATGDLPDGLVQFRLNLVEVLVDICQLLNSVVFLQKVCTKPQTCIIFCIIIPQD
ncbi:hypothetical protein HanXRQr2_Chr08g0339921 [Helianthus annuus]|uniref:Uncharacterized protein n=1 Tax=Helianthus annuus TaxID=4232 RepID=A0A9K3IF83_HELAN|nr:hypothetical protein HanXRQr2_Chr08g0339921 [Helianthus annuus]KAJ0901697.1 hypothetical protein HanPSC8_Chr08g0328341 [Helianthus annuus]